MSLKASEWAWSQTLQPSQKVVLLALADKSSVYGQSFPGINWLAEKCGVTPRTVQRTIRELQLAGLVVVEERTRAGGRGTTTNLYSLCINVTPPNMSPEPLTPPPGELLTGVSPLDTSVDTSKAATAPLPTARGEKKAARRIHGVKVWNEGDLDDLNFMVRIHGAENVESAAEVSHLRGEHALPSQVLAVLAKRIGDSDKGKRDAQAAKNSPLQEARARIRELEDPAARERIHQAARAALAETAAVLGLKAVPTKHLSVAGGVESYHAHKPAESSVSVFVPCRA
jgi:Helix-turn-helix domain